MARDKHIQAKLNKAWYAANREYARASQKMWRNSPSGARYRFEKLLKKHGITAFDWATAWNEQGGQCVGCLKPLDGGQKTCVDHCHQTGAMRGLLCARCNISIGSLGDCPATLRRLADYLDAHQASPVLRRVA